MFSFLECLVFVMSLFESFLFWYYKCYLFILQILTILNLLPYCFFISRSLSMNSPMREISLKILYFLYVVKLILEILSAHLFLTVPWNTEATIGMTSQLCLPKPCGSAPAPNLLLFYCLGLGFLMVCIPTPEPPCGQA